jgi:Cu-processing system permease protein
MSQVRIIAWKEFGDRFRSGWVIACALVWLGAIALTSLFGLIQIGRIGLQGYERTVVSLLNLVQYLVPLLALLLGHDLLVSEREEKTLSLVLAGGVPRSRVLWGKFLGGCLTLAVPLTLGFTIAGTVIGLAARDNGLAPFLKLALSGLVLGIVFLGLGLVISTFCRTRVQALVLALLAWCAAVFVFDLTAMGLLVTTQSAQAAREVEAATDATHVNAMADIHAAFESGDDAAARVQANTSKSTSSLLLINPVDLFRVINLPKELAPAVPPLAALLSIGLWLAGCLAVGTWKLSRVDL